VANLAFRAFSAVGFITGVLFALSLDVARPRACDIADGACLALVLRHEALVHVLPPVLGLLAGMLVGHWVARGVHRVYLRKPVRMG
jgi:hypothetical protein